MSAPIFDDLLAHTRSVLLGTAAGSIVDVAERHAAMVAALEWSPLPDPRDGAELFAWGQPHAIRTLNLNMWEKR